jgi:hypothetical protein
MKSIYKNMKNELQKDFTKIGIVTLFVMALLGMTVPIYLNKDSFILSIISIIVTISTIYPLLTIFSLFFSYLEESFEKTKLSNYSIATLFVKKADHSFINIRTLLVFSSAVYLSLLLMYGMFFPAAIVLWMMSFLSFIFN